MITLETLRDNIRELEAEAFDEEDLQLIFDEIAGASKKPLLRDARNGVNSNDFESA